MDFQKFYILAGGINIKNAKEIYEKINPYILDVASGVEENGQRSLKKIKELHHVLKK